jgi:hypothetical protein
MSNVANLKTALISEAAKVDNTIDQLSLLSDIDDWYSARVALGELVGKGMSSYSVGGRTVTRRDIPQLTRAERDLYQRILDVLYCRGSALIDLRESLEPWPEL